MNYTPPTTDDLQELKQNLGFTGKQMAELAGLAGDQQWRKYTGGADPREMSPHMAFFIAARMCLPPESLRSVGRRMQNMGAKIDLNALSTLPRRDPTVAYHSGMAGNYAKDAVLAQSSADALRKLGDPFLVGAHLMDGAAQAARDASRLLFEEDELPIAAARAAVAMAVAGAAELRRVGSNKSTPHDAVQAINAAHEAEEKLRRLLRDVEKLEAAKEADRTKT